MLIIKRILDYKSSLKYMFFSKKNTFEQHDNELKSYYRHSVQDLNIDHILSDNLNVDVCVIGGGLTGISSALNLKNKGYNVALVEARKIGWGASGRNGGQLGGGLRKEQKIVSTKFGFMEMNF